MLRRAGFLRTVDRLLLFGDVLAHVGVGLDILDAVVVHDAEVAGAEGIGHGQRYLFLGLNDLCTGFLCLGLHLLLLGHCHGAALLGAGLGYVLVGVGLIYLQDCSDVLSDVYVGDVYGKDLECSAGIKSLGQYDFGYGVRMLQHVLVGLGCSDAGYDTLADAGQDGLLAGSSDQLLDVGAHGHPGLGYHLYAVLCHGCHGRCVDDLGVDGHLHGLEYVTAGQVDGGCHLEVQGYVGLVGGDEGVHHVGDIALCQIMRLESIGVKFQA